MRAFWNELLRIAALEVDAGEVEWDATEGRRQPPLSHRQRLFRRGVSLVQQGPHLELFRFKTDGEKSTNYVGQPSQVERKMILDVFEGRCHGSHVRPLRVTHVNILIVRDARKRCMPQA